MLRWNRAWTINAGSHPAIPIASDTLSPAGASKVAQFVKPGIGQAAASQPGAGAEQRAQGRSAWRRCSGSASGNRSATSRACCQLARAAVMSRWVSHPPARMYQLNAEWQITRRFEVFGYQSGVFVGRFRLALFDRGGQAPVQLGAVRLELRFIGHGANQRMPERIFDPRGEPDLVDQLTLDELVDGPGRSPVRSPAQG